MNIVTNIKEWLAIRKTLQGSIGFVATMGNLHAGHLSLCDHSIAENDVTIVSIFINPAQFNQPQDFELYPRTLEQDQIVLAQRKVDYLFVPDAAEIYADHYQIQVQENKIAAQLEGEYRPGHFTGMLTVVLKLLNLICPNRAYFGEKDYQQLLLVKKMVAALFLPVEIVACPTMRAEDGLALSSRNTRLTKAQRLLAPRFYDLLQSKLTLQAIREQLELLGFKIDYIVEQWGRRLGAVWLDDVRLIDNIDSQQG